MSEQYIERSFLKKYINIFFTSISIALKENKEYKANFYSALLFDFMLFWGFFIFFSVYRSFTDEFIVWNGYDFILYFFIILLGYKTLWIYSLLRFNSFLLSGNLNNYLVRPVNSFFMSSLRMLVGANIITWLFILVSIIILMLFGTYQNRVLSILLMFFGVVVYVSLYDLVQSLAFFMKDIGFLEDFLRKVIYRTEEYTPKLFENTGLSFFIYLLPSSFLSYFTIELLRGEHGLLVRFLPYEFIFLIMLICCIWLLWKFGLRRYEAFG